MFASHVLLLLLLLATLLQQLEGLRHANFMQVSGHHGIVAGIFYIIAQLSGACLGILLLVSNALGTRVRIANLQCTTAQQLSDIHKAHSPFKTAQLYRPSA